jgi:hypothetical protein
MHIIYIIQEVRMMVYNIQELMGFWNLSIIQNSNYWTCMYFRHFLKYTQIASMWGNNLGASENSAVMSSRHSKLIQYQGIQNSQAADKNYEESLCYKVLSEVKFQRAYILKPCRSTPAVTTTPSCKYRCHRGYLNFWLHCISIKFFTCQFTLSPRKTAMRELKWKYILSNATGTCLTYCNTVKLF